MKKFLITFLIVGIAISYYPVAFAKSSRPLGSLSRDNARVETTLQANKTPKKTKAKKKKSCPQCPVNAPHIVPYTPPSGPGDFSNNSHTSGARSGEPNWFHNGIEWVASGNPPSCPEPLVLEPPVDFSRATSVLYPGQYRGGQYKPHGGFRFDNNADNNVSVKIPMDAVIDNASRYIQSGEVQYLFTFIAPCGIAYRFDHLQTLTPKFQAIADTLPPAKVDDSRTTPIRPVVAVRAGEEIATAVGFVNSHNVGVDFGVYDLRRPNAISHNPAWAREHEGDRHQSAYGVCWLILFPKYSLLLSSLPGGDSAHGKKSDYCG